MYKILKQCPLFRGLTETQIEEIIDKRGDFTVTEYPDKAVIARKESAYSGLMIILKGKVHGEITYGNKPVTIDPIEAPQLIAPAFLFGGYNRLPIDVIADGEVTILTLHRGYLFELMQSNVLILSNFVDIISDRANVWSKKIFYFSFHTLKEKMANYLLESTTDSQNVLSVTDMREIAAYFDVTRSALLTVLSEMEKRHLLRYDESAITVLNRKGLQDILK